MLKLLSTGIEKIPHLEAFLEEERARYASPKAIEAVAGWGHKVTAEKARALATKLGVTYIALEDGFIRSLDLGVNGAPPLSLSVDPVGCYYDAATPSLIEKVLSEPEALDERLLERARRAMAVLRRERLSKYNVSPDVEQAALSPELRSILSADEPRLLMLDQCAGDASLSLGLVPEDVALRMYRRARELYPEHRIVLKVHPDVIAGKRQGLLYDAFKAEGLLDTIHVCGEDVSVMSFVESFPVVFTASSQSGFEALLHGATVHTFGLPFYAGYGLTVDELAREAVDHVLSAGELSSEDALAKVRERDRQVLAVLQRRAAITNVTLEKLFAAVYFKLCRYVNPVTGQRTYLEDILSLLSLQKKINDANRHGAVVYGVRRWRHGILKAYLHTTEGRIRFINDPARAIRECQRSGAGLVQWASSASPALTSEARLHSIPVIHVEDGFLRSRGLGSNYVRPFSLVFDAGGIYYDPASGSDLVAILSGLPFRPDRNLLRLRAAALRAEILRRGLTKYNVGVSGRAVEELRKLLPEDRSVVLVPGQVEDDASVLSAGGEIKSNAALLKAVRKRCSDAFIIYKPHPDVLALNRRGGTPGTERGLYDLEVREISIASLYELVSEVHTLTSQSGFEALLRGLPVTVYGRPFYAGWGLTADVQRFEERQAVLSLDDLVAGVLIIYPRYYDWVSKCFMRPEDALYRFDHPEGLPSDPVLVRCVRSLYALRRSVYYRFQHLLRGGKTDVL